MPFPGVVSTGLLIVGTGVWALASILDTKAFWVALGLANRRKWSQGAFQTGVMWIYAVLMVASSTAFFVASVVMGDSLCTGAAESSPYNLATLGLALGTGFWALGSWLTTQQNQLSTLIAGSFSGSDGYWNASIANVVTGLVIGGLLLFTSAILGLGLSVVN
jgi:hypothetical protein